MARPAPPRQALAFTQACTYPDRAKVFCASVLELEDGKIVRQIAVQAWDGWSDHCLRHFCGLHAAVELRSNSAVMCVTAQMHSPVIDSIWGK